MALGAVALTGCSNDGHKAASFEIPDTACWGAFSGNEIEKIAPEGKKASSDITNSFDLYNGKESAICSVYVDGNTAFLASANRYPVENPAELRSLIKDRPHLSSIPVRDRGWVWDTGSATTFTCERPVSHASKDPQHPNSEKYIVLELSAFSSPDKELTRRTLEKMMVNFRDFAAKKLLCKNAHS
ncbi:hypothetical protein ACFU99_15275 [Streptomyces sp. NPDC057654]|uniref:hypothetical protein n=1 Tax=Streptomyces sp. NPDC057654 TaxID=3346196 RepID=UPI003674DD07